MAATGRDTKGGQICRPCLSGTMFGEREGTTTFCSGCNL